MTGVYSYRSQLVAIVFINMPIPNRHTDYSVFEGYLITMHFAYIYCIFVEELKSIFLHKPVMYVAKHTHIPFINDGCWYVNRYLKDGLLDREPREHVDNARSKAYSSLTVFRTPITDFCVLSPKYLIMHSLIDFAAFIWCTRIY